MIIGSGPIVIGQAAEFDFSGSQACRAIREEGLKVILVNSNPATIQTDPEMADKVYIEPLTVDVLEWIIEKERPDGILAGMGGQTALNLCSELAEKGVLDRFGVRLLGTPLSAIAKGEDRDLFKITMEKIGEPIPKSIACQNFQSARDAVRTIGGYPVIMRPAYTLGGTGSGIARNDIELEDIVKRGLIYSRIGQVLVEESVDGWAEFEYEVMRDHNNNCIIVCSMENLDPMGIHTGESIVIAPAQTLSDYDHQILRNASLKIIRALGIEGGCNIQFALNQSTGDYRIIEVNPRVSRSSALASKATGYPIARIAAKIGLGFTLDEILNPITACSSASFEPAIDYVVLKIPRWPFDKFRIADRHIGTQMKSTGEVMAIGRTIEESVLKAIRSLEINCIGLERETYPDSVLLDELAHPTDKRLFAIAEALRRGHCPDIIAELTRWNSFFINKIANIVKMEETLKTNLDKESLYLAKRMGFSDEYIAYLLGKEENEIRTTRKAFTILPTYKMVDTCAGEFPAKTPYFYSTYESECELKISQEKKVLVVGAGPIRIGQGIEFDYCCVHGVLALKEEEIKAIIINNNPETVSTDYDVSDRLYFEPLTFEDVMNVIEKENPDGVILQFGGQTSINLAVPLEKELSNRNDLKTRILGTPPLAIDIAEDRRKFESFARQMNIPQAPAATGYSFAEVKELSSKIGYPVLVRPSYVLGGKGMEIVHNEVELEFYIENAVKISKHHPVLVDKYLMDAIEIDVDAVCDGKDIFIGGIMEHIEEAGIHSGDASCVLPSQTLPPETLDKIRYITKKISLELGIVGLVNLQLAVKDEKVYVLEVNPRASRTVPFVSKAIGVPLAKLATKVMLGHTLRKLGLRGEARTSNVAVKMSVFPFQKLVGVDSILGPEMKSTGEVMGIADTFPSAYHKASLAAGNKLPKEGCVYITVKDADKEKILPIAQELYKSGLSIVATAGTSKYLKKNGIPASTVWRISEKRLPNALTLMRESKVQLVINTPTEGSGSRRDGFHMRRLAIELGIPFITTISAAKAAANAIAMTREADLPHEKVQQDSLCHS